MSELAQLKPEGMTISIDHPEIEPWMAYDKKFAVYFITQYVDKWYLYPFMPLIRRIACASWHQALYINAKEGKS